MYYLLFFVFKQKTAYEMRISDWSSDVCSSDLRYVPDPGTVTFSATLPEPMSTSRTTAHPSTTPIGADAARRGVRAANIIASRRSTANTTTTAAVTTVSERADRRGTRQVNTTISART